MRPQQSLKQWARAKQPAVAPETREERLARQQAECLTLSLPWPRPPLGRSVGRPTVSLDKTYRDHLYALTSSNNLPEVDSPVRPPWWRPEDCLIKPGDFSIAVGLAANRPNLSMWLKAKEAKELGIFFRPGKGGIT
eukprot:6030615-Amphidinium_carterae.1